MGKLGTILQVSRTFGVRDGMLRLQYELQRGSGLMSWKMRSAQGWCSWDLGQIAPGIQAEQMRAERRLGKGRFFFNDIRTLAPDIRNIIGPDGEQSVLAEAGNILAGHLPFFGQLSFDCGFPPRWFKNPATEQTVSPQQHWTEMRFASPASGDLKFILEPSRFLFAYPLVRAYALSGDERFPQAFWEIVEDWARQSPPMSGPLWICGQECSLRILAWSFALQGFIHSPATTVERVSLLISMIVAHAWRTVQTVGYARSQRSNHLVTEAVGLWTAGTLYPELKEASAWRALGSRLLREAALDQITPLGLSQQHSFNYQRMVLHLLLWTLRLAEINHSSLDHQDEVRQRTEAAFDFIRSFIDPSSGFTPNYGSDDGSLIFPLTTCAYRDFRPLAHLGAAALKRPSPEPGPWDEAGLWFGCEFAVKDKGGKEKNEPSMPQSPSSQTGYFRLGDRESWAMIRAGKYTRRPFQTDQLHVDLWWQGINLAVDAGTYLYNGRSPWNNGLAGTAVHNTVMIDGRDQMSRAGRFLWVDWAQASGRTYSSRHVADADCFEGLHDGYRNFGIEHRRMVRWLPGAGWVIVDDILGAGEHEARLHWLAADLPFGISDLPFEIVFRAGRSRIRWSIFAGTPGNVAVFRAGSLVWGSPQSTIGENQQLMGWRSHTYGDLQPAVSLSFRTRSALPLRFVTAVLTDDLSQCESLDGQAVISRTESGVKSEIHRVNLSNRAAANAENRRNTIPPSTGRA